MSKQLSPSATDILDRVIRVLQDAEELGGTDGTDDYLILMETVAQLAVNHYNAANSERGCGEVGDELRLTNAP